MNSVYREWWFPEVFLSFTDRLSWLPEILSVQQCLQVDKFYSAPDRGAEYCEERVCLCVCVCVRACVRACVCVCLSVRHHIFGTVRSLPNFLCLLRMALARSSSGSAGSAVICCVLPVLWIMSYLLISQDCSTLPPSPSAAHTQLWAWL